MRKQQKMRKKNIKRNNVEMKRNQRWTKGTHRKSMNVQSVLNWNSKLCVGNPILFGFDCKLVSRNFILIRGHRLLTSWRYITHKQILALTYSSIMRVLISLFRIA